MRTPEMMSMIHPVSMSDAVTVPSHDSQHPNPGSRTTTLTVTITLEEDVTRTAPMEASTTSVARSSLASPNDHSASVSSVLMTSSCRSTPAASFTPSPTTMKTVPPSHMPVSDSSQAKHTSVTTSSPMRSPVAHSYTHSHSTAAASSRHSIVAHSSVSSIVSAPSVRSHPTLSSTGAKFTSVRVQPTSLSSQHATSAGTTHVSASVLIVSASAKATTGATSGSFSASSSAPVDSISAASLASSTATPATSSTGTTEAAASGTLLPANGSNNQLSASGVAHKSGVPVGAVVGVTIAAVLLVTLCALAGLLWSRKRSKRTARLRYEEEVREAPFTPLFGGGERGLPRPMTVGAPVARDLVPERAPSFVQQEYPFAGPSRPNRKRGDTLHPDVLN